MPRSASFDSAALHSLAARQDGLLLHAQLVAAGMLPGSLTHRLGPLGAWRRVLPGVYLTSGGALSPRQRARAALLYSGRDALLTGPEALRLSGFRAGTGDLRVHTLIPHERRRQSADFVVVERSRYLPRPVFVRGMPCSPAARAVVDAGRVLADPRDVRAVVAEALQRSRCGLPDLVAAMSAAPRRRSALLRSALDEARDGIRSVVEGDARRLVVASDLPAPEWNVDLWTPAGVFLGCADAYWRALAVAWEIDSREWHLSPADWEYTMARHARLSAAGIIVVHTPPSRLRVDGPAVLAELAGTLAHARGRRLPDITAVRRG